MNDFSTKNILKIVKCLSYNLTKILGLALVVLVIISLLNQIVSVLMDVDTVLEIILINNSVGNALNAISKIQPKCSVVLTVMDAIIN